jgi:hypothetical protein
LFLFLGKEPEMKIRKVLSIAVLSAVTAGVAAAQEAPSKLGTRPGMKPQPMKAQSIPETYGTTYTSFHRMGGSEFTGMNVQGADSWNDTYYLDGSIRRYPQVANGWFVGTPHLPSGALVRAIYVQNCVNDGPGESFDVLVYACGGHGNGCTVIGNVDAATGCGYDSLDLSGANYVVDNGPNGNYLVVWVQMLNTDGTDSLAGVNIEYQLQVSPAPAVATFPDVPTSDFGYQFVEALVASGITGGCGGGLYCPDNFVTRRQMAIFIAKALGLHFQ